jgi:hypothetical protein
LEELVAQAPQSSLIEFQQKRSEPRQQQVDDSAREGPIQVFPARRLEL